MREREVCNRTALQRALTALQLGRTDASKWRTRVVIGWQTRRVTSSHPTSSRTGGEQREALESRAGSAGHVSTAVPSQRMLVLTRTACRRCPTSTPARGALFAIVTLSIALVRTTRFSSSHLRQSADPVSCSQRPPPPDARCVELTYPSDVNAYVAHILRCDLGRVPAAHISAHSPTIHGSPGDISHSGRAPY